MFEAPVDVAKIRVIGIGGGGNNAVDRMIDAGIKSADFVAMNTDLQVLNRSKAELRVQLGKELTRGLGAGADPKIGEDSALESVDEIKQVLEGNDLVFVTAGMGGGTGTGAAPVVAQLAKDMGILTVGIVTIPFRFEGKRKIDQALDGVEEIAKNVDALLVINNEKLRKIYSDLTVMNGFAKADDTLTVAAKSIAEIITLPGIINLDFADVNTTMKDGGVALMSNGYGQGEGRVLEAIEDALNSPLLSNNDVRNAKKILFNIYFSEDSELRMEEMNYVDKFMSEFNRDIEVIWGTAIDNTLGDKVKITILATGFTIDNIPQIADKHHAEAVQMTEEELRMEEERLAKEQKERERRKQYYGDESERGYDYTSQPVVLSQDELDNDTLIDLLEKNPTYNRDPKLIARARSKSTGSEVTTTTRTNTISGEKSTLIAPENKPTGKSNRTISFS